MHHLSKPGLLLALFTGLVLAAHPAHAQNLVQDGGFEAADPGAAAGADYGFTSASPFDTSWVIVQGTAGIDTSNAFVFDGSKSLYLDPGSTPTTIAQNLATKTGASYILSFYADDAGNNPLTVSFGGTTLGPINIPQKGYPNSGVGSNAADFTFYSFNVVAQSAFTGLSFSSTTENGPGIELDDIRVQAVPEASTVISMGLMLGLGGLAFAVRRKRTAV